MTLLFQHTLSSNTWNTLQLDAGGNPSMLLCCNHAVWQTIAPVQPQQWYFGTSTIHVTDNMGVSCIKLHQFKWWGTRTSCSGWQYMIMMSCIDAVNGAVNDAEDDAIVIQRMKQRMWVLLSMHDIHSYLEGSWSCCRLQWCQQWCSYCLTTSILGAAICKLSPRPASFCVIGLKSLVGMCGQKIAR